MNELTADNLHVWRGEQHVLQGVAFHLAGGRCLQVTGANGAGKTTLLRALCGLVPLEAGEIRWRGCNTQDDPEAFHAELSYLGHDHGLKADLTATENLWYAVRLRSRIALEAIEAVLARVGSPEVADLRLRQLSAGQRRRVALARVLLTGASLWVLDEPGSNLDAPGQELVLQCLRDHLAAGGLAVVATHQVLNLPGERLQSLELQ
jgi:heme exporter protein A